MDLLGSLPDSPLSGYGCHAGSAGLTLLSDPKAKSGASSFMHRSIAATATSNQMGFVKIPMKTQTPH